QPTETTAANQPHYFNRRPRNETVQTTSNHHCTGTDCSPARVRPELLRLLRWLVLRPVPTACLRLRVAGRHIPAGTAGRLRLTGRIRGRLLRSTAGDLSGGTRLQQRHLCRPGAARTAGSAAAGVSVQLPPRSLGCDV